MVKPLKSALDGRRPKIYARLILTDLEFQEATIMPQVNISLSRKLDDTTKGKLQLEIGNAMPLLPTKNIDNTHICLADGCSFYKSGVPLDGAFVDVRLHKQSPEESKKAFAEKMFSILKESLGIDPASVYMNFIEFENWASGGEYR